MSQPPSFRRPSGDEVAVQITGGGVTLYHFTDVTGAKGITGIDAEGLAIGQRVSISALHFGQGQNPFKSRSEGDLFTTDLGANATDRELSSIGVFGEKRNFCITFSEEAAWVAAAMLSTRPGWSDRHIFAFPGDSYFGPSFRYAVERVR